MRISAGLFASRLADLRALAPSALVASSYPASVILSRIECHIWSASSECIICLFRKPLPNTNDERRRRSFSRSRSPTQGVDVRFTITTYPAGHDHPLLHVTQCPPDIEILEERLTAVSKFRFLDTHIRQVLVTLYIEKLNGWPTQFRCAGDLTGQSRLSVTTASHPGSMVVIGGRQTVTMTYHLKVPAPVMERVARVARTSARIDEADAHETVMFPPFGRLNGAQ